MTTRLSGAPSLPFVQMKRGRLISVQPLVFVSPRRESVNYEVEGSAPRTLCQGGSAPLDPALVHSARCSRVPQFRIVLSGKAETKRLLQPSAKIGCQDSYNVVYKFRYVFVYIAQTTWWRQPVPIRLSRQLRCFSHGLSWRHQATACSFS